MSRARNSVTSSARIVGSLGVEDAAGGGGGGGGGKISGNGQSKQFGFNLLGVDFSCVRHVPAHVRILHMSNVALLGVGFSCVRPNFSLLVVILCCVKL